MGKTGARLVALFFALLATEMIDKHCQSEPMAKGRPAFSFHKRQPQNFANVPPIRSRSPAALDHQIIPSRR